MCVQLWIKEEKKIYIEKKKTVSDDKKSDTVFLYLQYTRETFGIVDELD